MELVADPPYTSWVDSYPELSDPTPGLDFDGGGIDRVTVGLPLSLADEEKLFVRLSAKISER